MAKKHPIYRLHRIKVHHNRWLIWAIAYSVIVAIAIIGYISVSEVNFESQIIAENNFHSWHTYKNFPLGFSVRYPADWAIEADDNTTVDFVPNSNSDQGVTIAVTAPASEKAIRKSLKILREASIMLDGQPAQKITNDLGRGHSETVILAAHMSKLYVLRGSDSLVRQLQLTFRFE